MRKQKRFCPPMEMLDDRILLSTIDPIMLSRNRGGTADLAVSLSQPSSVVPGTATKYTITVTNKGPSTLSSLNLIDTIPTVLQSAKYTPSTGSYSLSTGNWSNLSLRSGQKITLGLSGTIDPKASGSMVDSVKVATLNGFTDPVSANNSASLTSLLTPKADLAVSMTGSGTVQAGGSETFVITVTNMGPSAITGLNLNDTVPTSLIGPTFTPSTGSYNASTGAWTGLAPLLSGQKITMTLKGTVAQSTQNVSNTASVTPPTGVADPSMANNSVTVTDQVASSGGDGGTLPSQIPVISFHGIGPVGPYDMTIQQFKTDIDTLYANGYHSITLQQYLDWRIGINDNLPTKPILLTDDDGDVSSMQMTPYLQADGYTMVAFIVTGFLDSGNTYNVSWAQLNDMLNSGTWEAAFHAGAQGHNDFGSSYFYDCLLPQDNGPNPDLAYQNRVTAEMEAGIQELASKTNGKAYTNVFAFPFDEYGQSVPPNYAKAYAELQAIVNQQLKFAVSFVEDTGSPYQYRFEVHSNTSTTTLLASLSNAAFNRPTLPG